MKFFPCELNEKKIKNWDKNRMNLYIFQSYLEKNISMFEVSLWSEQEEIMYYEYDEIYLIIVGCFEKNGWFISLFR